VVLGTTGRLVTTTRSPRFLRALWTASLEYPAFSSALMTQLLGTSFARQETHQPRLGLGALGPDTPALFLLLYNDVLHVLSDQPVDDELDALMSF
jgi:hypothetical protein